MEDRFTQRGRKVTELCSEIKHLRSRERPRSRRNTPSPSPRRRYKKATNDTCFYHANFGIAARKCQSPCKFAKKPPSQTMIAAAEPGTLPTSRILFIIDLNNRLRFLIDSGAEISLIPPKPSERLTPNPNFVLQAVNRSNIKTYGQKLLELDLGLRRTFRWIFVVADVHDPILGADFLHEFNLSPHLRASRLIDHTTHLSFPCLQKTSVLRRISTVPHSIPDKFSSILRS